ncbi:hypothetical protein J7T55_004022 [Diaporthe amygdali]|uniref:uncharacterized protein n=1 Tax=Phomopsis amygdali TaxID=1214568 RepID=UPI0022FE7C57|nr:uncharacterized protein J7T55_004022 [Diaporthe amygdali]KAJ0115853.1 hypothetical protein J7T55_004022 [Diaporthe amygdali]
MIPKFSLLFVAPLAVGVLADGNYAWQAPSSTDRRSPCPMVNTLANHGYLPRDGLNITLEDLLTGFTNGINLDPTATLLVGVKALETSTTGTNSSFNLDDLSRHGIIEHDGSLSRADIYFGDNHSFNSTIWETVASYFTEDTIDVKTAARARAARLAADAKENPEFNMTSSAVNFSLIESALYLSVFNNGSSSTAVTEWVKVMFQHERLPFEEGYTRPESIVSTAGILAKEAEVAAASIGL